MFRDHSKRSEVGVRWSDDDGQRSTGGPSERSAAGSEMLLLNAAYV